MMGRRLYGEKEGTTGQMVRPTEKEGRFGQVVPNSSEAEILQDEDSARSEQADREQGKRLCIFVFPTRPRRG